MMTPETLSLQPRFSLEGDPKWGKWEALDKYPGIYLIGRPIPPPKTRKLLRLCYDFQVPYGADWTPWEHTLGDMNYLSVRDALGSSKVELLHETWWSPEGELEGHCTPIKWPNFAELALPLCYLAAETDFLELFALVVEADGYPREEEVAFGLLLRGKCVEVLPPAQAISCFRRMQRAYGVLPRGQELFPLPFCVEQRQQLIEECRQELEAQPRKSWLPEELSPELRSRYGARLVEEAKKASPLASSMIQQALQALMYNVVEDYLPLFSPVRESSGESAPEPRRPYASFSPEKNWKGIGIHGA